MALEGVKGVLIQLKRTQWKSQQTFEQLRHQWPEIVGELVAAQTRPVRINPQRVLQVATSSAVWAQNLAFERRQILAKVNRILDRPVTDIQFSAALWHRTFKDAPVPQSFESPWGTAPTVSPQPLLPKDAQDAFSRWADVVQQQAQSRPRCPACECPSPLQELQRWTVCALCASRGKSADAKS
jgi:predicted nucleic acid-binding Zn ribbon protein